MLFKDMTPPKMGEEFCPMIRKAMALGDEDLRALLDALNDPTWQATDLAVELTNRGFKTSMHQIYKHRSETCSCAKSK